MSRDYVQEKAREKADEHVRMCMKAGLRPSWESLFMAGYQEAADYENHIRIARYDRAVKLLRECVAWSIKSDCPGLKWIGLQVDRESYAEAMAFLTEEPK